MSNGWKGGDFFILLCLSFALYPILTLGNAVLSAMQESNLMELFPVAHPQDLALRHFIAASVPAVLAHGMSVLIGALWLDRSGLTGLASHCCYRQVHGQDQERDIFEPLARRLLCAFDDIEPRSIEEADFLQPYWPELPRTPSYFALFRAVLYAS